ncbi:MAG: LacI family DNA-binding transcriptional regulator [Capsulimonadales bacterium]|nr:LacI family DNA-binding transcriptional regulator [Capsulimonadales bacterium]
MKVRSTLKDVATAAGVSPTTVSLYLNGFNQVCSDETATRIRQAVSQLQYTRGLKALNALPPTTAPASEPSRETSRRAFAEMAERRPKSRKDVVLPFADALPLRPSPGREGETTADTETFFATSRRPVAPQTERPSLGMARRLRTIGVSLPTAPSPAEGTELSHPAMERFAADIWAGASEMAEWEEFRLLSFPRRIRTLASSEAFTDGSIGGLILEAGYQDPRTDELTHFGLPVVLLNRFLDIPSGCGAVYPMERNTVETALDYLRKKGHQRIAFYGGPIVREENETLALTQPATAEDTVSWSASDFATMRYERYQASMRRNQQLNPQWVYGEDSWDGNHAAAVLHRWRSLPEAPTAVFCASDSLAIALWAAAEEMGLSVPEDLSIIGVGDSPEGFRQKRPLTTIALPGIEIGREAVRLLLQMIEGLPPHYCRQAVPLDRNCLIERNSVAHI